MSSSYPYSENVPVSSSPTGHLSNSPHSVRGSNLILNDNSNRIPLSTHISTETLFHILSQWGHDLLLLLDSEYRIRYATSNASYWLGYEFNELLNRKLEEIVQAEDWPLDKGQGVEEFSVRLRQSDGTAHAFESRLIALADGYLLIGHEANGSQRLSLEIEALIAIARDINALHEIDEFRDVLKHHLQPLIGFDELFISLVQNDSIHFVSFVSDGVTGYPLSYPGTSERHPIARIVEHGGLWVENEVDYLKHPDDSHQVRAFINVALRVEEATIGILHLDAAQPREWSENEIRLAHLVGEQVSSVVHGSLLLRQRAEHEAALSESLALLRAIQEASADGICLVNSQGQLASFNRRFSQLWNISAELEAELRANESIMAYVLSQLSDPDEFITQIGYLYDHPNDSVRGEISLIDGRVFERYSAPAISETDGRNFGRIWTFSDISDRKDYERKLAHQAFHDSLTNLANRALFSDRLTQALVRRRREQERRGGDETVKENNLAVLFLDLDRFKVINDSLGHEVGDELLIQVAGRLRSSIRPGDTAARFGGDEFVILLEDFAPDDNVALIAEKVAQRIVSTMRVPFFLAGQEISVSTSIGIVCSQGAEMPDDLLRKADLAMYRAKNSGRAQYQTFNAAISDEALDRLHLELDLNNAIKRGELEVLYEPVIELATNHLTGFEAIVVWNHPARSLIRNDELLSLAEETGQIVTINSYALRVSCSQIYGWNLRRAAASQAPLSLYAKLSIRQIANETTAAEVQRILRESKLPSGQLVIEFTQSSLGTNSLDVIPQLESIKAIGVGLLLNNFGTGCSPLAALGSLPLDALKLDKTLLTGFNISDAIIKAITSIGHALKLDMAVEGVDSQEQRDLLLGLGYQRAQGRFFFTPLQVIEVEELLDSATN